MRQQLNEALKDAMRAKDANAVATLRLILAALKDRDIAARSADGPGEIGDDEIVALLQTMVKQRRESIGMYKSGGREDLAEQEAAEIGVIERFLPRQLDDAEIAAAVAETVAALEAKSLKDMGRVMADLRSRHAGQMDFAKAGALAKQQLSS